MNDSPNPPAQFRLGKAIRAHREAQGFTLEQLASRANITYQYLSGVENGRENFTISVLERLATALSLPFQKLVGAAYAGIVVSTPPQLNPNYFRTNVPLPGALTFDQLAAAMNRTQAIFHRINNNMLAEVRRPLQDLIQGNNFSGLVSNVFSDAMHQCSSFKHNHHQRYPDLICETTREGLEVKATIQAGKCGESHNGHAGWHVVIRFEITDKGIEFLHVMFGILLSHQDAAPDWKYVGSKVNEGTGSRRTETYSTTPAGNTKLRDGSAFLNPEKISFSRWQQQRVGVPPTYSIFNRD